MTTVLVTGGSGLIGRAIRSIAHRFPFRFVFVASRQYDLTVWGDAERMFYDVQPDYVIHLAAHVGGLYKNMNEKVDMLEKNILINIHVVHFSHVFRVKKLIACLSTCIFPDTIEYPIDESMLHEGPPHPSNETYAHAKRMLEVQCRAYREQFGDDFTCVIPTNIYGPHDNFHLEDAHVIPSLIHKAVLAQKDGTDLLVRGSGRPLRQFIFSEDVATLMVLLLQQNSTNPPLMILSVPAADETSILNVAQIIADLAGVGLRLDGSFADGQFKKTVTNRLLLDHFPGFVFTSLEEGLQRTVEWFIDAHNKKIARV